MSSRADVESGRLVYTCNCGWLDNSHADATAHRPNVGAASLWAQITGKTGVRSKAAAGFKVTYRQDMGKSLFGVTATTGVTKEYFVADGLTIPQQESVALAIFQQVSMEFESYQGNLSWITDSGFSAEDLVSNLVGFYSVVRPRKPTYMDLCGPCSKAASLAVWDKQGPVGKLKNKKFEPILLDCDECRSALKKFPAELQAIALPTDSSWVRPWTRQDELNQLERLRESANRYRYGRF